MGVVPHRGVVDPAEPAQGFRLPGLRVARGARRPQVRRVLRERRQGRRRGGHQTRRHARSSSPGTRSPTWPRGPSTGCASRAGSPIRWCCAPATTTTEPIELGRRLPVDRRASCTRWPAPNEAVFYTSGRTSNEAAFLYQLLVRSFGTNNLPDCSNMCHESSGAALTESIGIGKGSVTVEDVARRRPDHHRRPEPGHQPSADAVGAGEGKGATAPRSSRSTRCPRPA